MYIIVKKNENFPPMRCENIFPPHMFENILSPTSPRKISPPPHSLGGGDTMTNRDTGLRGREGLRKIECSLGGGGGNLVKRANLIA